MKLKGTVGNAENAMTLEFHEEGVTAVVDDRQYELVVRELENGDYLLLNDTKVSRCRVRERGAGQHTFEVSLNGQQHEVAITDPKRLRSGHSAGAHHHGSAEIVSPMPGKVVRVLRAAGDEVKAGEGVLVVEAMKMQNELKSPKAGVIASINAEEGSTVNAGDVLAVIE